MADLSLAQVIARIEKLRNHTAYAGYCADEGSPQQGEWLESVHALDACLILLRQQQGWQQNENEWQPIETAPKIPDRTVLLWWTTRGASSGYYDVSEEPFGWRGDQDLCLPRDQHHCTHWMPLPSPPSDSEAI
jgi:hypothetical protein